MPMPNYQYKRKRLYTNPAILSGTLHAKVVPFKCMFNLQIPPPQIIKSENASGEGVALSFWKVLEKLNYLNYETYIYIVVEVA